MPVSANSTCRAENLRGWRHIQVLLPVVAIYLILALYAIDRQSLWEDEFSSLQRIASPIPIWQDGHGFLYFALLRLWTQLGDSLFIVRSLSVFFGATAVCLLYAIGYRLFSWHVAIIGSLLLATSPYFIWYSQEARYITLVILATLLMTCAFIQVIRQRGSGWWISYGVTSLLALFSFLSTLLLPVVQGLYLLTTKSHRPLLFKWLACQIIVSALFVLWFVNGTHFVEAFIETRASNEQTLIDNPRFLPFSGDFNNVRPAVIPYTLFAFSTGFSLGPPPRELYADRTFAPLVPHAPLLFVLAILYGGVVVSGLIAVKGNRQFGVFLLLWLVVPILGVFAIAKLLNIYYDVRYVAMALPAYVLLLGAGIARFQKPRTQLAIMTAVLAVHGFALANYYFDPQYAREDTRSAGQFLANKAGPRDAILVVGSVSSLPHYYKGDLVDFRWLDGAGRPLGERLQKVTHNKERLWLVEIRPWQIDRAGKIKALLDDAYAFLEERRFPGVDIYSYQVSN